MLADDFSLEFEGQQVSSNLQDLSQDSGRSKQCCPYLPTPPLGQDMTQGQFLRGV